MMLLLLMMWLWPSPVQATTTITAEGCIIRDQTDTTVYVVMKAPTCTLTSLNDQTATLEVTVDNVDPDAIVVKAPDAVTTIERLQRSVVFTKTFSVGSTVTIRPWVAVNPNDWYFVALGDNQPINTVAVNPIFEDILEQVELVNPIFFTNSGDLIDGINPSDLTNTAADDETLQAMYEALLTSLDQTSTVPMYAVAGNHDTLNDSDWFDHYFGADDYVFDFGNIHFVGFNSRGTSDQGEVGAEQLTWLTETLSSYQADRVVMWYHHPVSAPSWTRTDRCCFIDSADADELANSIDAGKVDLVINGHAHGYDYRFLTNEDVSTIDRGFYQLITGGAGGQLAQTADKHHFTLVHVTANSLEPTPIIRGDFATTVDYFNNTGSKRRVSAVVHNSGNEDLPYVRLKFKLKPTTERLVAYDDAGISYNIQSHTYDHNYTIVYLETAAPANSNTTYTVTTEKRQKKSKGFKVKARSGSTTISALTWGEVEQDYYRTWTESPSDDLPTTYYRLKFLPPHETFSVQVNTKDYTTVTSNAIGQIRFEYNHAQYNTKAKPRHFHLTHI